MNESDTLRAALMVSWIAAIFLAVLAGVFYRSWRDEQSTNKAGSAERLEELMRAQERILVLEDAVKLASAMRATHVRSLEVEAACWDQRAQDAEAAYHEKNAEIDHWRKRFGEAEKVTAAAVVGRCRAEDELAAVATRHSEDLALEANRFHDAEVAALAAQASRDKAAIERDRLKSALIGVVASAKHAQQHLDALEAIPGAFAGDVEACAEPHGFGMWQGGEPGIRNSQDDEPRDKR